MQIWSSYSINGQSNVTHLSGSQVADRLLLYQSEEMPYAQYTLQVYVGHAEDDVPYYLDWIEYNTSSRVHSLPPTISLEATTSTPPPISPTNVSTASDTSSSLPSNPSGIPSGSHVSQGAIVLIAVLVGASMLGAFAAMYLMRRKRTQSSNVAYNHQGMFNHVSSPLRDSHRHTVVQMSLGLCSQRQTPPPCTPLKSALMGNRLVCALMISQEGRERGNDYSFPHRLPLHSSMVSRHRILMISWEPQMGAPLHTAHMLSSWARRSRISYSQVQLLCLLHRRQRIRSLND